MENGSVSFLKTFCSRQCDRMYGAVYFYYVLLLLMQVSDALLLLAP